jgi:hypothetical protein
MLMPKIQYVEKNFRDKARAIIKVANEIIAEYQAQGFDLTLRQLYYQFVARDLLPNTERSYKNLGSTINDGRLAGLIDWRSITDRTRNLSTWQHYDTPQQAIQRVRDTYDISMWEDQPLRVEVWIEKEALVGVINNVCGRNDVPYFACRGYVSQSEQWRAGQRFKNYKNCGHNTVVLHLGDLDPSGMDLTRDNNDRLDMFSNFGNSVTVKRIALNMDQIDQYGPPPNPAKLTDSRADQYITLYGYDSWELDALQPQVLTDLIQGEIDLLKDTDIWETSKERLEDDRAELDSIIARLEDDE